ncbi:MAG: hypothetical protein F6K31_17755 [Symploca sp. SIO2G7]|nr:hypothetical protein [Symploca sp. SIO2G7]
MVNLQTQFNKFHNTIKIDFDDSQPLRDKRDIIIKDLKDGLKTLFRACCISVEAMPDKAFKQFFQAQVQGF